MAPEDEAEDGDEEGEDDALDPATWAGIPDICGSCIAFKPEPPRPGETKAAGSCKLRPEIGRVPASLKKCSSYLPRGRFTYTPGTARAPTRKRAKTLAVIRTGPDGTEIRTERKVRERQDAPSSAPPLAPGQTAASTFAALERPRMLARPPRPQGPKTVDLGGDESAPVLRQALVDLVRQELGRTSRELHTKFKRGGVAVATTADGRHTVEVRAERFFATLDRVQSALSAFERAVGKRKGELGPDVAEIEEGLRTIRGSFTTFNVLFEDRADYFSSKD